MSTIHAAQVTSWGAAPTYTTVPAPPAPPPSSDIVQIRVLATGVHQLVRSRAAGQHYTSGALPHIVGVDGVGTTEGEGEDAGKTVYFVALKTGACAERVNVPRAYVFDLPERTTAALTPEAIAAIANPAMSSWMALKTRVDLDKLPKQGWTVLVLGATSASGSILDRLLAARRGQRDPGLPLRPHHHTSALYAPEAETRSAVRADRHRHWPRDRTSRRGPQEQEPDDPRGGPGCVGFRRVVRASAGDVGPPRARAAAHVEGGEAERYRADVV
ncbi:hypothetical protein C8Q74DRAFT_1286571 [Fomes fomentarius]|nr:hypothetical protein C8Q74DRAFT_1286571 [Fomes fomentarius]